eukprot:COSAG06_NODE_49191_length_327_cov_0.679825_1_plen_24_part_01
MRYRADDARLFLFQLWVVIARRQR